MLAAVGSWRFLLLRTLVDNLMVDMCVLIDQKDHPFLIDTSDCSRFNQETLGSIHTLSGADGSADLSKACILLPILPHKVIYSQVPISTLKKV